jgi:hypothetical protein
MSKFSDLPKRVLDTIIKTEKKFVTYPLDDKIKRLRDKFLDMKENRELIVVDKFGNRYYQYYSYHGLPTRRVVINNMKGFNKWDDDPLMSSWLQKRRVHPPSQEELEKLYIEQEEFQRRGLEWDRKEQAIIDEWKKRKQEAIERERQETKAIGEGDSFEPGVWDRKSRTTEKNNPLLVEKASISDLAIYNQLVEMKEEKRIVEGMSDIPGKYIVDFKEEDEKWMQKQNEKKLAPYKEMSKNTDWSNYSVEKMVERRNHEFQLKKEEINNKKQELTNIGKKMLEKKETFSNYSKFKNRFKDVFEDPKFSI